MTQSFFDGLRYISHHKLIFTLLIGSSCVSVFSRSYIILLPVFAKEVLHTGASGLGFISAAPGLGTIIGALALAALGWVKIRQRSFVSILVGLGVALFIFGTAQRFVIAFPSLIVAGALGTIFETLLHTLIQLSVVDSYRGRVMGVYGLAAAGLREFGGVQAGFIAEWAGAPFAIQAGAVIVVLVAMLFFYPQLKRLPET
jgi:MFS family permease